MRTDTDALMVFLAEKLAAAELALKAREQAAKVWSSGSSAGWRMAGSRMTKSQRLRLAEAETRIAEKCKREVEMFRAVIARLLDCEEAALDEIEKAFHRPGEPVEISTL